VRATPSSTRVPNPEPDGVGRAVQVMGAVPEIIVTPPAALQNDHRRSDATVVVKLADAAFARKVRARPSDFSTFEAIPVHLRYGPATRSPSFKDGFVNRLQDRQFPSFPLFKLRGLGLLPRWDSLPLVMPAFAGRTHFGTNLGVHIRRRPLTALL
jgi:hypothetical protein